MLPGKFIISTFRQGKVYPGWLQHSTELHQSITSMVELLCSGVGTKYKELESLLSDYHGLFPPRHLNGILYHLFSYAQFTPVQGIDLETVRGAIFDASASAWKAGISQYAPENQRNTLSSIPDAHHKIKESPDIADWLYSDIATYKILTAYSAKPAAVIINDYNIKQVQGLLLQSSILELMVPLGALDLPYQRILNTLKSSKLLFRVENINTERLRLHITGPVDITENKRSYDSQLAKFFYAMLEWEHWQLQAKVWYKKRFGYDILELDQNCPCQPPDKQKDNNQESAETQTNLNFVREWNSKYGTQWLAEPYKTVFLSAKSASLLPDIILSESTKTEKKATKVYLEILHHTTEDLPQYYARALITAPAHYLLAIREKKPTRNRWNILPQDKTLFFTTKLTISQIYAKINLLKE